MLSRHTLHSLLQAVAKPANHERLRLNQARWQQLPAALKVPQQAMGRRLVACGATHGLMERCNFACTSCYLTEVANTVPPLPFAKVKQQLDALRRALGPAGKTQITSGEVTLLPRQELGRIIAYARDIGLIPMVMTHGERFLEERDYLIDLVRNYGLTNVGIHIDTTQRGRKGLAAAPDEAGLHPTRDRFADLLREVRSTTGRTLHAAHTVTVTRDNIHDISSVVRWVLGNADAFRILSLQPSAQVGRTIDEAPEGITLGEVWEQVCDGIAIPLERDAIRFGHRECTIICPMIVVTFAGRRQIVESVRRGNAWDKRVAGRIMEVFGGIVIDDTSPLERLVRIASLLLRNPQFAIEAPIYALYRLWGLRRWLLSACANLRTLRLSAFAIVVHKFMSEDEIDTPLGRERLQACAFKVPVDGEMVSMCEVNATDLRRSLNDEARGASEPLRLIRAG